MASTSERWIDSLKYSSLFWPLPRDPQQQKAQITAYVKYFGQFTSANFQDDIAELVRSHYPSKEERLLDCVLAMFVLHHPEYGVAVLLPIISGIIDDVLVYNRTDPPFASFISLVCPSTENEYSEQWALGCGEILRILTVYNRPIYKQERENGYGDRSGSSSYASTSELVGNLKTQPEKKPIRPLSPWITDLLLAAPLGVRSDYFRWCGGVMGKYAAGELKPPTAVSSNGSGKHPQLMPSTPKWATANGAGVILSVCDEEVARYDTVTLTAAAVPALLLPPPTLDENVAGLPALEPYARLYHRYYSIATPSATQRLLLGLLEAPPSWAPDALDAAVQLVELLRAAEEYATGMRLPRNWMHLHFLRAIGTAMSMRAGVAADAAAALLYRILSQPALLFPPLRQVEGVEVHPMGGYVSSYRKQIEVPAAEATIEATAQGIASILCAYGPEVEWRICTIWEAAYGLIPLSSSIVDLPEVIVATPLQPPILSWNLYIPLLKVLEYLPRGSPSEACLMKIFVATVEAILERTFPPEPSSNEENVQTRVLSCMGPATKNLAQAELRTMVHALFMESCASVELASRLLFVVLTVCIGYKAQSSGSKRPSGEDESPENSENRETRRETKSGKVKKQNPVAAFDSYVVGAIWALAYELQLFPKPSSKKIETLIKPDKDGALVELFPKSSSKKIETLVKADKDGALVELFPKLSSKKIETLAKPGKDGALVELDSSVGSAINHTQRILAILEALFLLKPSSIGTSWSYSSTEILAAAMVAAHVSELFRRSKASMKALSALIRCKWDNEIHTRASSLYNLIDVHSKVVASIVNKAEPYQGGCFEVGQSSVPRNKNKSINPVGDSLDTETAGFPLEASDLANFLTMDRHLGLNCSVKVLLRSVLSEKPELCFSVVSLLWHKLIAAPEIHPSAESTSAQQGWRQVVVALCNVVSASPTKAATAVVLQAERELQPWLAKNDDQVQKVWRINQRIIRLIVELMRNHDSPDSLVILASASDLLLRATDGLLVDGEACTLPQLELLEVTARVVLDWGESGLPIADGLSNLLKLRLPAIVTCLSHESAHVRALSTSVLRDIRHTSTRHEPPRNSHEPHNPLFDSLYVIDWKSDIEKCLLWEARSRTSSGMSLEFLSSAAKELGFTISL